MAGCIAARAVIDVVQLAIANIVERNDTQFLILAGITAAFIVEEKEKLLFFDGAAQAGTELIANESRPVHSSSVVEKGVGLGDRVAVVFVRRAMPGVGAALGDQLDLRAAAAAQIRGYAGANSAKLFHRIDR